MKLHIVSDEQEKKPSAFENAQKIDELRQHIPSFTCIVGCHDCCGPVTASSEEVARLPVKTDAEHDSALAHYNCVYLGQHGCEVYAERPLICRLFGTTQRLACPNGKRPVYMTSPRIEEEVHHFLVQTRQVLL
ncbi:MAG: YkgJ family cysteine cluster protein [Arenimonas sp.]